MVILASLWQFEGLTTRRHFCLDMSVPANSLIYLILVLCAHLFLLLRCEQRNLVSAKFFLVCFSFNMPKVPARRPNSPVASGKRVSLRASVRASSAAAKALSSQTKRPRRMTSSAHVSSTASPVEAPDHNALLSPQFLALASTIVQDSLGSVSSELTGLPPQVLPCVQPQVPGQLFNSVALPVDARVSDKIRAKIWNHEYVDFGSLHTNPTFEQQYHIKVRSTEGGPSPSLCIEPVSKPKKISSIEAWLSSFHVFVGVYTKCSPHEAAALIEYGEIVQDLAGRGHNWKFYDENFRFLRQMHGSSLPWDRIHEELWLKSQLVLRRNPQSNSTVVIPKSRADIIPKGYCFRFHKNRKCSPGCAFKHLCFKCEGHHSVTKRIFRDSLQAGSVQSLSAKSHSAQPTNSSKSS